MFTRVRVNVAADAWFGWIYVAAALAEVTLGVLGGGLTVAGAWAASMRPGLRRQLAQLALALSAVRTGSMALFLFPLFFLQGLALFFGPTSVALLFAALYCKGWLERLECQAHRLA